MPSMVPKPPVSTTPPITAAAIASNSFKFPFAASAVLTSNTWQVAKTVAQKAENINKATLTLSVGKIKNPSFFELTYSFRQSEDENFYSLLNNIRLGENLEESINQINRACFNPDFDNESSLIITTRKYRAEQINEEMLNFIEGPATSAKSEEFGEFNENDLPAPRNLRIKKGAKVMFIKNDSEGRWVNGTIGEVTNCSDKKGRFLRVQVGNDIHKVKREEWNKIKYIYDEYNDEMEEEIVSSFTQHAFSMHDSLVLIFPSPDLILCAALLADRSCDKTFDWHH